MSHLRFVNSSIDKRPDHPDALEHAAWIDMSRPKNGVPPNPSVLATLNLPRKRFQDL